MNFDAYINFVDLVTAELQDIRSKLELAKTEVAAGRCPPVIHDPPRAAECALVEGGELAALEQKFRDWFGAIPDRLPDIPPVSGENV